MEGFSRKRGAFGMIAPKKGYNNVGFKKGSSKTDDPDAQFCNRIGCSGRIKYTNRNTNIGTSVKASLSNNTTGSSSIGCGSLLASARSSFFESKRKISSRSGFDPSESSQSGDSESRELLSSPRRNLTRHGSKNKTQEVVMVAKNAGSSSLSNIRPGKAFHHKSESYNQNTRLDSKSSGLKILNNSSSTSSGSDSSNSNSNYDMRKLKCNSMSDIVQRRCSSSQLNSLGKSVTKKKNLETGSSLPRKGSQKGCLCPSTSGVSISDSGHSSSLSGDSKNAGSIRTRRPMNLNYSRTRLSQQQNGRNSLSLAGPSSGSGSSTSNNGDRSSAMPFNTGQYNMDGMTEVLLAIERFQQNERRTNEQVLALDTNLFLSGLNMYDQHRDMRLDIDNMSYEDLLALEERMGTVSTALSEEALLKSVKKSIYEACPSGVRDRGSCEDGDDIKCSICQEEYGVGDETGKLVECRHGYHLTCINQWLRLKNWCPICKSAVAPQE